MMLDLDDVAATSPQAQTELAELRARLAEEVENAATYKQERDEICVNYETVAAKLSEAHRQNADLMAIIDKRDEALGFIPLDKGMDMQDELREVKARLAEATEIIREARDDVAEIAGQQCKPHRIASYAADLARVDKWLAGATVSAPVMHASDCAVHNEPALPVGPCNCGAAP